MNIQKELEKLELELQEMEKEQEYLKASFYVNQKILPFLQKYNNSGIYKTKIQEYKEKLRDIGKKSINEMQSIEFETPIDGKKINDFIKFFTASKDLETLMYKLGSVVTKNDGIIKSSKETMPISYQFANRQSIDDKGNVISGGEEDWYYNIYHMHQSLSDNLLELIFLDTIKGGILTEEGFIKFISSKPLFLTYSELLKFAHGIHTFFVGDYVSSIHILIPLLEKVILNVSVQVGIDTISLLRGKEGIGNKTIGKDFISSKEFQDIWGLDLATQINFVLYDNKGYNLRHSLAHGEIEYSECNMKNGVLIIFLYIAIATRLKVQTIDTSTNRDS